MEAKQTPLIELLERIPQDARLVVEHDQFSSSVHPVGRLCREAAAALRAALGQQAEPAQEPVAWGWAGDPSTQDYASTQPDPVEPVAWRWGYRSVTTGEMDWRGYVEIAAHPNLRSPEIIIEPLYTAPPRCPNCGSLEAQNTELDDMLVAMEHAVAQAAAVERKACADICDAHASCEGIAQRCAADIRARGQA